MVKNLYGTCVKTSEKEVLFQDEICKENCGDMEGQICTKGCMTSYAPIQGMTLIKDSAVDGHVVDAVVINNGEKLTTIIYPKHKDEQQTEKTRAMLVSHGLSKSEVNVFLMVMEGKTNSQIAKELFVSKSTLKTHLNNIYKKLPQSFQQYKGRR